MKGLGASAVAAAGLSYEHGPVGNTQAVAPLVAGALAAGALGLGWSLRDYEIIGADAPAEGLTADALRQQIYQTAKTRKSTNASTFIDNQNILDGVEHTAYTDAKVAAIEELNAGSAESAVLDAATSAIDTYETTVKKNLLKSWNESHREFEGMVAAVASHPDLSLQTEDAGPFSRVEPGGTTPYGGWTFSNPPTAGTISHTLPDGSTIDVLDRDGGANPLEADTSTYSVIRINPQSGIHDGLNYFDQAAWHSLFSSIDTTFQNVRNGISTWVTTIYGDVQSGSIEVSELVTPRERASMMAKEEGTSQAIADLIALNQPVDLKREATITVDSTGATMRGSFGLSDASDGPLEVGVTYDPSTFTGDVYFTTDMSLVEGDWTAINTAVDGGTITITQEPYEGTAIEVETIAGETVSVPAADWTDNGDGTWSYDASGDLETAITEVASARFHATSTETQYETLKLDGTFTVDDMVNTQTGEPATATTFTSSEPQTDSNYITQEEWDQLEQQNQELIEQFENSQSNGGGLDLSGLDMFGLPGEIVAVVVAGAAALFASSN
ncbi:hypothetical protein [Halorubrum sp. BV1]|uniref:hypothetical protein n=1 Tax=Halorubrum sp. BV1 TaxID=1498500 RepID=UPI000678520A|nr:hypothetical protein [Halorubrum sp. BV1]